MQEVFIKVYRNLNGFDSSLKFSSWIYRITHNQVISEHRKHQARPKMVTWENKDEFINNIMSDFDITREIELNYLRQEIAGIFDLLKKNIARFYFCGF